MRPLPSGGTLFLDENSTYVRAIVAGVELMLLDASSIHGDDVETPIASLLASPVDVASNGQRACDLFGIVLAKVFHLLPSDRQTRYWDVDDFSCDFANRTGDVVTLQGTSSWLAGGQDCDRFRLDFALDKVPLLYSCKFTSSATGKQVAYVGKIPEGG
jgi:hypothetical protein